MRTTCLRIGEALVCGLVSRAVRAQRYSTVECDVGTFSSAALWELWFLQVGCCPVWLSVPCCEPLCLLCLACMHWQGSVPWVLEISVCPWLLSGSRVSHVWGSVFPCTNFLFIVLLWDFFFLAYFETHQLKLLFTAEILILYKTSNF